MPDFEMNFKGMAIGNGWVSPFYQYPEYATFSYDNGLIDEAEYEKLSSGFAKCQKMITDGDDSAAYDYCSYLMSQITGSGTPDFNVYDIRIPCEVPPLCYDFSNTDSYLN